MYFKINSSKRHKLKEEFKQIQIPPLNFYYLQEKEVDFQEENCWNLKSYVHWGSPSTLAVITAHSRLQI